MLGGAHTVGGGCTRRRMRRRRHARRRSREAANDGEVEDTYGAEEKARERSACGTRKKEGGVGLPRKQIINIS